MNGSDEVDLHPWRPLTGPRLLLVGARTAAITMGVFAIHAAVTGATTRFWVVIAAALPIALPALVPGVLAAAGDRLSPWLSYAWLVIGLAMMVVLVLVAPRPTETWLIVWGMFGVNVGFSLPPRGQILVHGLAIAALYGIVQVSGLSVADRAAHVALYIVLAAVVAAVAGWLRLSSRRSRSSRESAEHLVGLLGALARMNALDLEELAEATVSALADLGYDMITFGLVEGDHLHSLAARGFPEEAGIDQPLPIGDGLAGLTVRQDQPVIMEDYQAWPGRVPGRDGVRGAVGVPVRVDGRIRAVILGASSSPGAPDEERLEAIELMASQAARVLSARDRFEEERRSAERMRELADLKSDFIASVSHELRTPMTIIAGLGETLHSRRHSMPQEARYALLERVNSNAERLDGLIAALLELSRLEAGSLALHRSRADLDAIITDAVSAVGEDLDQHEVRVEVVDVAVDADPRLLEHVLASLLGNAAKHTPRGSVVRVTARRTDEGVTVTVEDDGPGVDGGDLPFLTERFYRGGHTLRRENSGLGLGLAVASRILAEHDAALTVGASELGGAAFSFTLPVALATAEV